MSSESKYHGCFLGLAIGDAYGANYEGGALERLLWKWIGKTKDGRKRYTDDTQMSINLAESFLQHQRIEQDALALAFAKSYRWSRGYGPSAGKLLKGIQRGKDWRTLNRKKFKEGSMGNGAAMRAPIVALCYPNIDESLSHNVTLSAEITHAHPEAIEGALIIAKATVMALHDRSTKEILTNLKNCSQSPIFGRKLEVCADYLVSDSEITNHKIKKQLGNGILASTSCITALYFALKYSELDFSSMLNAIFDLGGDADTIAAMAGAIWGAFNGVESVVELGQQVEDFELILDLAGQLWAQHEER